MLKGEKKPKDSHNLKYLFTINKEKENETKIRLFIILLLRK